jgi:hypothetical protein
MLVGLMNLIFISMGKKCKSSWIRVHEFFPEDYHVGASPSALKKLGGGQLNTQHTNLKLFLNSKEEHVFLF